MNGSQKMIAVGLVPFTLGVILFIIQWSLPSLAAALLLLVVSGMIVSEGARMRRYES